MQPQDELGAALFVESAEEEAASPVSLNRCYYLAFHCPEHEFRIVVENAPAHWSYPCPLCQMLRDCTLLVEGGTQRLLPLWDEVRFESADAVSPLAGAGSSEDAQNTSL